MLQKSRKLLDSNSTIAYNPLKMATDKLIALCILMLFSPVIGLILAGMFLVSVFRPQDRGPVIYREPRYSQGRRFYILKFRVLKKEMLQQVQSEKEHSRTYEKDITNLTLAGRYLKKWYLDELPQLISVLRGDMSLVGPRPWPEVNYKNQLARGVIYRKLIMAGWTGPGQLCKGRVPEDEITQCSEEADMEYVARCRTSSPFSLLAYDLKLLLKTVHTMLEGKGIFD